MSTDDNSSKPNVLRDAEFTIQEGVLYRVSRTGAIWMNKLFFSAFFLLGLWLLMGAFGTVDGACTETPNLVETENGTVDQGTRETCSVWLSQTAVYLGTMTLVSFIASMAFGFVGLIVGKNIMQMTPTAEEVGAQRLDEDESP